MGANRVGAAVISTLPSTFLLTALLDPRDDSAWPAFVACYRPALIAYAQRTYGFGPDDAEDIAQTTLVAFLIAYRRGDYQRDKGRLRYWLYGIAKNRMRERVRERDRNREFQVDDSSSGIGLLQPVDDDAVLEGNWENEWRRNLYLQAMIVIRREFRPATVDAFLRFVQEGCAAVDVAKALDISENAVYLAKHRILKRLRDLIAQLDEIG